MPCAIQGVTPGKRRTSEDGGGRRPRSILRAAPLHGETLKNSQESKSLTVFKILFQSENWRFFKRFLRGGDPFQVCDWSPPQIYGLQNLNPKRKLEILQAFPAGGDPFQVCLVAPTDLIHGNALIFQNPCWTILRWRPPGGHPLKNW